MNRPVTRKLDARQREALAGLLKGRGHALAKNPKNRYIAFEARTEGRSIFTLYTSGKLVSTVREGDAEGLLVEEGIAELAGEPMTPAPKAAAANAAGTREGLAWMGGADETGTGELLGTACIGGAMVPRDLVAPIHELVGHVETKSSRTATGWERLGDELAACRADGLVATTLAIPNRLFDAWAKHELLDLAYVRIVVDLLAGAGLGPEDDLSEVEMVVDDYGTGPLLARAREAWRARGMHVVVETKADMNHLAVRAGSVLARSARAREMQGAAGEVDDGPLGTGNAGHAGTKAWLRRRARSGRGWPSFVKTSFRTVWQLEGGEAPTKRPLPPLEAMLDRDSVARLLAGSLDVTAARLLDDEGVALERLVLDPSGRGEAALPAGPFLSLLFGAMVLDAGPSLDALLPLLDREQGLLSGWRVLVGPDVDEQDPVLLALARAHRAGIVALEPTRWVDPDERARRHGALRLVTGDERPDLLHATLA